MSEYMSRLRAKVGHDLLFVSASGTYVFDAERRVLLIRHAEGGRWTNPGGMVEPFETPADAAIRETWEETGLLVELTRFIGVFGGRDHHITYGSGDEMAYVAFAFEARVVCSVTLSRQLYPHLQHHNQVRSGRPRCRPARKHRKDERPSRLRYDHND